MSNATGIGIPIQLGCLRRKNVGGERIYYEFSMSRSWNNFGIKTSFRCFMRMVSNEIKKMVS